MSIASQCADCCTCPTPVLQWDSVSASRSKCGWLGGDGKIYKKVEGSGSTTYTEYQSQDGSCSGDVRFSTTVVLSGEATITESCIVSDSMQYERPSDSSTSAAVPPIYVPPADYEGQIYQSLNPDGIFNDCGQEEGCYSFTRDTQDTSYTLVYDEDCVADVIDGYDGKAVGSFSYTLSDEYTTAALIANTLAALPAFDNDWDDTPGSSRNFASDELSIAIRESRYRIRFPVPQVLTGKCYRVNWVERFIASAGVGIDSAEVYSRGRYRPTVTLVNAFAGGSTALAAAVMASDGTVSAINLLNPGSGYAPLVTFSGGGGTGAAAIAVLNASGAVVGVTITNPGSGYTSAPTVSFSNVSAPRVRATGTATVTDGRVTGIAITVPGDYRPPVTVQAAISGGTTSTGWVATMSPTGQVLAITGGTAGNYLPTGSFSGGGGTGATITFTLDPTGGIASANIGASGSGYTSAPTLTISSKVSSPLAADILLSYGTEAAKCAEWDGTTLAGEWVVREVADGGHPLTSIEVVHGGSGFVATPTVTITGGGGTGATATAAVSGGAITAINLTNAGSGYTSNPLIRLSYYGSETVLFAAHFGTETEYADGTEPPGAIPKGYVPGEVRTYPIIGDTGTAPWKYYEIDVPTADGTTTVANVRAVCDCTSC